MPPISFKDVANRIAERDDSDIIILNADLQRDIDNKFIAEIINRNRRTNVILVLVTSGGSAEVAYRIARCMQDNYANITVFVTGWCKSAGTLLAIGANRLVISDFGELGPLDVQVGKRDELFEFSSGLDVDAALKTLQRTAFNMFEEYMLAIQTHSGGRITFKTASEIASALVTEVLKPIYAQIDPMKIGETERFMTVAKDYGKRLSAATDSMQSGALDALVSSYSIHGFTIDFREAKILFSNVTRPDEEYRALQSALGRMALHPITRDGDNADIFMFINDEKNADATEDGTEGGLDNATNDFGSEIKVGSGEGNGAPRDFKRADEAPETGFPAEVSAFPAGRDRRRKSR